MTIREQLDQQVADNACRQIIPCDEEPQPERPCFFCRERRRALAMLRDLDNAPKRWPQSDARSFGGANEMHRLVPDPFAAATPRDTHPARKPEGCGFPGDPHRFMRTADGVACVYCGASPPSGT